MAKAIHSMIRVLDEALSIDFYDKAFELKVADRPDFDTFTLVYMSNDECEFEVELTIKDVTFLAWSPESIHLDLMHKAAAMTRDYLAPPLDPGCGWHAEKLGAAEQPCCRPCWCAANWQEAAPG
ncbi:hypothetical protein QN224_28950 [Sinorhizobium sp. 8-89]|uniref:hypothetical protein n=1 Tax=Sinorhizobium sp. 7-81 TaxID=3049087 RepID=UPI0024C3517C|nr:hypothetical protein [Sinorhizobium sp. 7-81]MDK1389422.1 hypothetical protein [Sinorhizobium sp. 7-81]